MSHVLLLSPDDQVVNAITAVLEEMSLTCDRPLDGGSAAQKLNSQTFDLVLVDCENLPAAKLIFDVCRRGKNGYSPVPIAIVDGRAGLPTAFRLGAELILTKPVSKDQARTTIRAAVGRVKKDGPVSETAQTSSLPLSATASSSPIKTLNAEDWSKGASGAVSSQLTSSSDPAPSVSPAKAAAPAAVRAQAPVDELHHSPAVSAADAKQLSVATDSPSAKPKIPFTPSDDPVLAEIERAEMEATEKSTAAPTSSAEPVKPAANHVPEHSDAPVFSSYQHQRKSGGVFVALMALVIAAGGLYGAWMYEPGFRTFAQPQIDRIVALAGMALPQTQPSQPHKSAVQPVPAPAPSPAAAEAPSAVDPNQTSTAAHDAPATSESSASGAPASSTTTSLTSQSAAPQPTAVAPPSSQATPATTPVVSRIDLGKTAPAKPAESKKKQAQALAPALDAPLPGESSAIILSSKGAEKRLAHSVPAKYPAEARSEGAEGTVVLKEIVDENGKVTAVRLVEGNATLATAAMQAVKQWRYRPYVRDGKAQPFQTVVIVDFQHP